MEFFFSVLMHLHRFAHPHVPNGKQKMAKPKWLSSVLDNDQNQIMKHRMEVVGTAAEKQYP